MQRSLSLRLLFSLMLLWWLGTIAILLGDTAAALRDSSFPIVLGLIKASGFQAVLAMLLPVLCGLGAPWLILKHRPAGPLLLLLYSLFWLVSLAGGALEQILGGGLIPAGQTPWHWWVVGGTALGTMIAGFVLMAYWSVQQLREADSRQPF